MIGEKIMYYLPLTTNPLGWLVLGVGGVLLYKAGKRKGVDEAAASQITETPEPEKTKTDKKGDKK